MARRRAASWSWVLLASCGRLGFDAIGDGDAGGDGSANGDAVACVFGPWSTPQMIAELAGGTLNTGARVTPDETTIYWHSIRPGGLGDRDIWSATRATVTDAFGTPTNHTALNTTGSDRDPTLTDDGLTIVFATNRLGEHDVRQSTRGSTSVAFPMDQPIPSVNTLAEEYFPMLSPDGLDLYFSSNRPNGAGGYDIWHASRPTLGAAFGPATSIPVLNGVFNEYSIVFSSDGLEAIFSANNMVGEIDIYTTTRSSVTAPFAPPVRVPELSAVLEDHPGSLSRDGRRLYMGSDRSGTLLVYLAKRDCL